jgi:hypothetical protein
MNLTANLTEAYSKILPKVKYKSLLYGKLSFNEYSCTILAIEDYVPESHDRMDGHKHLQLLGI